MVLKFLGWLLAGSKRVMTGQGFLALAGNLFSDVVTKKNTDWWKPKNTVKHAKMKTKGRNSCCIGHPAYKSGRHPQARNQAGVKRYYLSKIILLKDSLQGHQNCLKLWTLKNIKTIKPKRP